MNKDKKIICLSDYLNGSDEILSRFGGKNLVVSEGKTYFGKYQVHPEMVYLMRIPFDFFVTVTFERDHLRKSESEIGRRKCVNDLLDHLNRRVLERHPSIVSGKKTVRAAWSVEYGDLDPNGSAHCHLLVYLDQRVAPLVRFEVLSDLKALLPADLSAWDVATLEAKSITGAQADSVSYVCKVEFGREFKLIEFSKGFRRVIKKLYLPKDLPEAA